MRNIKTKRAIIAIALVIFIIGLGLFVPKEVFTINGTLLSINPSTTRSGVFGTNSNTNFPASINYDDGNYSGSLSRGAVSWTTIPVISTITATSFQTSTVNSFPGTMSYSDINGYTGTLTPSGASYVVSGSPAGITSQIDYSSWSTVNSGFPATKTYNSGGYSGTLTLQYVETNTKAFSKAVTGTATMKSNLNRDCILAPPRVANPNYSASKFNSLIISTWQYWDGGSQWGPMWHSGYGLETNSANFTVSWVPSSYDISSVTYNDGTYSSNSITWANQTMSVVFTQPEYRLNPGNNYTAPYVGQSCIVEQDAATWTLSGTAYRTGYRAVYSGTVAKADDRVYQQNYSGSASKQIGINYSGVANYNGTAYQKLNAVAAPTNTSYSLASVPGTESITISGIQSYDVSKTIDSVKASIWKGATKVAGDYSATLNSTSGYYKAWNNIVFNLPNTLGDGSYTIKISSYSGGILVKEIPYTMVISTPINLKGYINGFDIDSGTTPNIFCLDVFSINATTSIYTANAKVKFPFSVSDGVTTYAPNTEIALTYNNTTGNTKFYSKNFTINGTVPDGNYAIDFVGYANNYTSIEKQTKSMLVYIYSLKINSLKVTNIVHPMDSRMLPVNCPTSPPIPIKSGYNVTLSTDIQGASEVRFSFYCNGSPVTIYSPNKSASNEVKLLTSTTGVTTVFSPLYFEDMPMNSIIDVKVTVKNSTGVSIVDDVIGRGTFKIVGTFREDFNVNLIR